jgi:hypothetical protein
VLTAPVSRAGTALARVERVERLYGYHQTVRAPGGAVHQVGSPGFVDAAERRGDLVVIYNHSLRCAQDRLGAFMARPPNYSQDKKRREEAARKKREEKQQRRQQKKDAPVAPTQ